MNECKCRVNAHDIERVMIEKEKRGAARKPTRSSFLLRVESSKIEGMGSDISASGAYFVTCDDIPVEVVIRDEHGEEREVMARIKRIDHIAKGSRGVAIEFDTPLKNH